MLDLKDALMIELAYCRTVDLPVSETAERIASMVTRKHDFWTAGDPNCPREIKAGNGELHTLRCKNCGSENARERFCLPSANRLRAVAMWLDAARASLLDQANSFSETNDQ